MNKNFRFYMLIWVILLIAFQVLIFLIRPIIPGFTISYDTRFWTVWAFIIIVFVGNLLCAYFVFREENLGKMFYHIQLIDISWSALIAMFIGGCVLMLIPNCPGWISVIVCIIILAFNAIAAVKAVWVSDTVEKIDEKVKVQTNFIRNLTADAENILSKAKNEEIRKECKRVYEAVRYSDPMSNDALSDMETQIMMQFDILSKTVTENNAETIHIIADKICTLISARNRKCKVLK